MRAPQSLYYTIIRGGSKKMIANDDLARSALDLVEQTQVRGMGSW